MSLIMYMFFRFTIKTPVCHIEGMKKETFIQSDYMTHIKHEVANVATLWRSKGLVNDVLLLSSYYMKDCIHL